jgi:sister-chromatid-cohesion protein PDS5
LEHYFVDFAHLLAHHPDFTMDTDDLQTFEVYLKFYLDTLATAENISFLYYASAQLKMVRDKHSENSLNLYVISEISQVLIREHCATNNWILQTYPGKIGISRDLFEKLGQEESGIVMKTVYLEAHTDFMKHRMKKTPLRKKSHKRSSPVKDDEDTDSDQTQIDGTPIKTKKHRFSPKVDVDTPMRRSERTKKPISMAEEDSE